jgi:hypothetical protein
MSERLPDIDWLPFDSGRTDQSLDRRDVPEPTSPYPAAGFKGHMSRKAGALR